MWFDELNAWGISAASPDLKTLFRYVHYEGHPWLWYFLLWIPSRLTHNPLAMKGVVALFGTAIYLVLGLLSPFTRLQKILLFLSYFVAFEYTVTLRMYGIMFLLALLYAWHRSRKPQAVVANVALLAIMTNTDMTGALLSGALLLEYAYSLYATYRTGLQAPLHAAPEANRDQTARISGARMSSIAWAALLYIALLAASVLSLLPARDISWQSSGRPGSEAFNASRARFALANVSAGPWWPVSHRFPHHFWETDAHAQHLLFVLAPIVLFAYWRIFRRQRNLLLLMALTVSLAFLFADFIYIGRVRHWGICFVSLVVGLWLQRTSPSLAQSGDSRPQWAGRSSWSPEAYALMSLSALAGVLSVASSWTHPFSQSAAAARWIQQNEPSSTPITGEPDVSFISVAQQLQRPVYQLECGCIDTFKLFSHAHDNFEEDQMGTHLAQALTSLNRSQELFILYRPLTPLDVMRLHQSSLTETPLAQFPGAELPLESFWIYRITRP